MMRQDPRMGILEVSLDEVVVVGRDGNLTQRRACSQSLNVLNRPTSGCSTAIKRQMIWARNNTSYLIFTFLFFATNIGLFITRAYEYRHTNFLIMGARACGQCLNLDCVLLLTLILRRFVTKIRNSSLGKLLPCDSHVQFHKMAGWSVFFLSILHSIFHLANFAGVSQETGISIWTYLVDTRLGIGWIGGLANPTGLILALILTIIVSFSHRCVRKSGYFEIFYWTHLLSLPFWVLLVLHAPCFWKWLLIPGSAFLVEMFLRIAQVCSSRGRSVVLSSVELPSEVVKLVIKRPSDFEFRAGEYVYLNIPSVARYEWHPFTISSAPEQEDVFTVHIRTVGGWTRKVHELFTKPLEKKPLESSNKLSQVSHCKNKHIGGILNPTFISPEFDERSDQSKTPSTGTRYSSNLREFNRKMSNVTRPAILMVETEKKLVHHGVLERKKSSSLNSLTRGGIFKYDELLNSGSTTPYSGRSSLTGSRSSLRSQSESESIDKQDLSDLEKCTPNKIEVCVDGPYGSPSSRIFRVSHAVLVGAGIGVTPFASILQSVMYRYREAKYPCPNCHVSSCLAIPATLRKLRKVDFIWVNRDLSNFEWFLELLASLEEEQAVSGAAMERFLRLHLYKTGMEPIQPALPLASHIHQGRPDWDKVLSGIRESRVGRVCVFYCGPPALAGILRDKCIKHKLEFSREMF